MKIGFEKKIKNGVDKTPFLVQYINITKKIQ